MKKFSIVLAIIALAFASLACQTVLSGNKPGVELPATSDAGSGNSVESPTLPAGNSNDSGSGAVGGESEFPMPDGASNVTNVGGTTNFQVKMSLSDAMKFYKDALTKSGYKERTILTVTSDTTFSMVFDGHKSGKAIVVQGVDLKNGSVNISIRLEGV